MIRPLLVQLSLVIILLLASSCGKDLLEPNTLVRATVDQDPTLPQISVNGTSLHLQTFGDPSKPVIIFLHGGPGTGDSRAFTRMLDEYNGYSLIDEYFVILYDQRGAGLSKRHGDYKDALRYSIPELTLAHYLADLEEIVNSFSPDDPIILFGHSWGGMHAMMYVNKHPNKVAGVILSEPGSFNADIENQLDLIIASSDLFSEEANDLYWFHQNISPNDHVELDYIFMNGFYNGLGPDYYHFSETDLLPIYRFGAVASVNDLGPDGMLEDGTYTFDFSDNLEEFSTKVLFINGDLNEVLDIEFQQKNMDLLPNTELRIIENVGHDLIWTAAEKHVELIKEYLDEEL